ncbi:hypothetical protein NQ317_000938 [Molorchus minor]|uniref:Peptidase C1A papain C-terminal domain-containing protein n=1 Tax=Molorchus minor TaxID=1323400 RepID=A0ABQ9JGB5_9CUCU|nr:hypothetical protein NQ317_000938 [Molorchus minor]
MVGLYFQKRRQNEKNFVHRCVAVTLSVAFCDSHLIADEFIESINQKATTWTARKNFENYTTEQLKALAGVKGIYSDERNRLPRIVHNVQADGIPDTFDSREVWPECSSIGTIRNQGQCGSCWAFAAVEVMSDRLCIFSAGAKQFVFSPEELVSCCTACGSGCDGGMLNEPFIYWTNHGIPSGGDEGSNYGCMPYTAGSTGVTPQCNERCLSNYDKSWSDDIRHGIAAFEVTTTVEQIQHEIMINGPVEAFMTVYQDFYNYGSGIYQYTEGSSVGGHAVKILGWGTDNGIPYWLAANSWGTDFGENGFFRILRGSNNVDIESYVTAGNPNTDE